eukprot:5523576-Heterocapsa_arctica.AAC.1
MYLSYVPPCGMYWTSASCWLKAGVFFGMPTRNRTARPEAAVTRRRRRASAAQASALRAWRMRS